MTDTEWLQPLAERLSQVGGVRAVLLGGSRARGEHTPESDFDLGLYYEHPLDIGALQRLATEVGGPTAKVTGCGEWGPWVDGGGWLSIGGVAMDWIYRDTHRVRQAWEDALHGTFAFHSQVGHPLGVPDFAYAGEVALGVVLTDPAGGLTRLQQKTREYPPMLADALVAGLWEADFLLAGARKAVGREDAVYIAGCLFRIVGLCAHALHGRAGRWVINEKGLIRSADRLDVAPPAFEERALEVMGAIGSSTQQLTRTLDRAEELIAGTTAACQVR